ncbi:MAG: hypothetical protein EBU90_10330 [Proteobacteria bacterium]|nr:hypothetical protein [Pseudomonadota bacterium]NBP13806.1 hypothetical protein [bacterium]
MYWLVLLILVCCCWSSSITSKRNSNCVKGLNFNDNSVIFNDLLSTTVDLVDFNEKKLVYIENIFDDQFFQRLQGYIRSAQPSRTDTFQFARKAGTVKASNMPDQVAKLYYSRAFISFLSHVTGITLQNVNCDDESSMNLLVYDEPGDFINWHRDPNHYMGQRITVLICITNTNSVTGELSSAELYYKEPNSNDVSTLKMKPNSILVFDGSSIEHMATGISENDERVLLSFTYCDTCKPSLSGKVIEFFKQLVLGY